MKYMIASDLHGSALFTEKLLRAFDREQPRKLLLLGDLLYHGARNDLPGGYDTKEVTRLLNGYKEHIIAVRGNCDSEVDQLVLSFPMSADSLYMEIDDRDFILTHGHVFDEERMIPHSNGTVLLHGHTHVKAFEPNPDFTYVNPGSTSIPKDGDTGSFLIYEDGIFTWKDMDGGILKTARLS